MDMSCRLFCHNQLRSTQIRIFSGTPRLTGTGEPLQVKECHLAVERPHSPNSVSKKRLDFKSIHLSPVQKNMFDSTCVSNRLEGLWSLSNDPAHMRFFLPLQAAHLKCRYKTQTCFVYLCIVVFYVSEQQLKHSSEGLRLKHVTVLSL